MAWKPWKYLLKQCYFPTPPCLHFPQLIRGTFCYNQNNSWADIFIHTLSPIRIITDYFWSKIGIVCVVLVFTLCGFCVISYLWWVVYYELWDKSAAYAILCFMTGGWLLLNASFNYIMAVICGPGCPPEIPLNRCRMFEICKKCKSFKPPRSHHCSSCRKCVLLMDHHCPWINNCVGHKNFRHFFLFCCFTCAGCFLIVSTSNEVFCDVFYGNSLNIYPFPGCLYPLNLLYASYKGLSISDNYTSSDLHTVYDQIGNTKTLPEKLVTVTYIITSGVGFALFFLCLVTGRNISVGETTVEAKINLKLKWRLISLKRVNHHGCWIFTTNTILGVGEIGKSFLDLVVRGLSYGMFYFLHHTDQRVMAYTGKL